MLGTLVVGLGRAGAGLHIPVLRRLRRATPVGHPFAGTSLVAVDPHRTAAGDLGDTVLTRSMTHAARLTDPANTVVHLCTPPTARVGLIAELADLGFRRFLVEKPMAADEVELDAIMALRAEYGLDLLPVGQWRCSELTDRMLGVLRGGRLGELRSIVITQRKPRFARTLAGDDHPSAFDVEAPHAIGLALTIAGGAVVTDAGCGDLTLGDAVFPRMGRAWLHLLHGTGVRTEVRTDLTAPVRERRVTLELTEGTVVGHFPISDTDCYAQLFVHTGGSQVHSVFADDSLSTFILRAYRHFSGTERFIDEPSVGAEVVRLIAEAKRQAMPSAVVVG